MSQDRARRLATAAIPCQRAEKGKREKGTDAFSKRFAENASVPFSPQLTKLPHNSANPRAPLSSVNPAISLRVPRDGCKHPLPMGYKLLYTHEQSDRSGDDESRTASGPLRDPGALGLRRHGDGLPGAGYAPQSPGRPQGSLARQVGRHQRPRTADARSPGSQRAESP